MAREALVATLAELFPDITVVGSAMSVAGAVEWLSNPANKPDMIFMDVELSDGKCFEIFRQIRVTAPVIMTTAYDNYAVKAFEVNSVDYLLKPLEPAALRRAVERCRERISEGQTIDIDKLLASLQPSRPSWKETLLVPFGDHLVPLRTADVAYIYSEEKLNHILTRKGEHYMIDESLDSIASKLDPSQFFKISRSAIVSRKAVGSLTKLLGGRLRIELALEPGTGAGRGAASPEVSRSHTEAFLSWIDE